MADEQVRVILDIVEAHADIWRDQAPVLGEIPGKLHDMRFRNLSTPGAFATVMAQHEALVAKWRDGCREGSAIWSAIEQNLRIAMRVYENDQAEARRRLTALNDAARADPSHPMAARLRQTAPVPR
jgi:hypothetical protein